MKRLLWALIGACLVSASLAAVDGPLTPFANLRGRTDANGYLLVAGGAYTAADGPLTNLANLRVRTDSNGYLIVALTGGSFTGQLLAPTGCTTVPYSFTGNTGDGICMPVASDIGFKVNASERLRISSSGSDYAVTMGSGNSFGWCSSATAGTSACLDTRFRRTATKTVTFDDGAGGPLTVNLTGSSNLNVGNSNMSATGMNLPTVGAYLFSGRGGLDSLGNGQFRLANASTSAYILQMMGTPTCSSNCGTSPSVSGSDSSMTVTMGGSGSPASGFVVTFAGTWSAAPQCTGGMGLNTMAVGKLPMVLTTTTTTLTVTTNGTAPGNSDKYHFQCSLGS